jgi:hypothetical protein
MPNPPTAAVPTAILDSGCAKPLPLPRTREVLAAELRQLAEIGALDLPLPGGGDTATRWAGLATLGRCDLALARLAEGHTDALAILAEADRAAAPDALYGVWAARSGGTGAQLARDGERDVLTGTVRFCSGAILLDRALVAAAGPDGDPANGRLVELDLTDPQVHRDQDSWPAIGMDASDSIDVRFAELPVTEDALVGPPGFYLSRKGFTLGSGGVAAVWLGGAAGAVDAVHTVLRGGSDPHQLAHLGVLHAALRAADALLTGTAHAIDRQPDAEHALAVGTCRAAAERVARDVLDLVPRITGPTPLSRDRRFAQRLADLGVYVRQHHAERDLAALGRAVLAGEGE